MAGHCRQVQILHGILAYQQPLLLAEEFCSCHLGKQGQLLVSLNELHFC